MLIAEFSRRGEEIEIDDELWQYDYGQKIQIKGLDLPEVFEVHFAWKDIEKAKVVTGSTVDGVSTVDIPNIALEQRRMITAYIYLSDTTEGETVNTILLPVNRRKAPENFEAPEDVDLFHHTLAAAAEYQRRAKESEKNASTQAADSEAWAHGREDHPEQEQDNAKYYAEQAAASQQMVSDSVTQAQNDIGEAQQQAIKTITEQQGISIQKIKNQTAESEDNLKNTIRVAEQIKTDLDTEVENATPIKQGLDDSNTAAIKTKVDLDKSNTIADQIKAELEVLNTTASKTKTNLDGANKTATDLTGTLENEISEGIQTKIDIQTTGETAMSNLQAEATKQQEFIKTSIDDTLSISGKAADAAVTGKKIDSLKEDISTKITKFFASNQGETHITDSDNGKIMDMKVFGKSSQDGTPSVENPVEIKSVVNPTTKLLGSNILKMMDGEYQENGLTVTVSNGAVKIKGTSNDKIDINLTNNLNMFFKEGTEIIFSPNRIKGIEGQSGLYLDFSNNNTKGFSINNNNINTPYIIKKEDTKYSFNLYIRCSTGGLAYAEIWEPQILIGKTITPFKPYTEQTITLPITLNAIPVSSGGNVTIDGQQYIADYVDVERGKVVRMCERGTFNTKNGNIDEEYRLAINIEYTAKSGDKECIFSAFKWVNWETCVSGTSLYIKNIKKSNNEFYTAQELKELSLDFDVIYQLAEQQETDLTTEQTQALKELVTYYPVTNISVNSEQLDGYTVFNYPISMVNGWNYVKQQLNDNRDYIYDMDTQSAEAYVNSEYAVALTELEV